MKGKRTGVDFSNHIHTTKIFRADDGQEIQIDYFKKPNTWCCGIKFTNNGSSLLVEGDYGRWSFCRPFYPGAENGVSDCYWNEKLEMKSTQQAWDFNADTVCREIDEIIEGLDEEEDELVIEWWKYLKGYTDNETEYNYNVHYDYDKPDSIEYEDIPNGKEQDGWLNIIYDSFDIMCERLKNNKSLGKQ